MVLEKISLSSSRILQDNLVSTWLPKENCLAAIATVVPECMAVDKNTLYMLIFMLSNIDWAGVLGKITSWMIKLLYNSAVTLFLYLTPHFLPVTPKSRQLHKPLPPLHLATVFAQLDSCSGLRIALFPLIYFFLLFSKQLSEWSS